MISRALHSLWPSHNARCVAAQSSVRQEHAQGQAVLQKRLLELISDFGACTNCMGAAGGRKDDTLSYVDLPIHNLLFDGSEMWRLDYTDFTQGVGTLCVE